MQSLIELQRWLYGGSLAELKNMSADPSLWTVSVTLATAALFGFAHALMPGHGKAVMVSYFLGRPSGALRSIGTSAILVVTHVGSAVILVLAGFQLLQRTLGGAGRSPALEVASGSLVILIGLWLLLARRQDHSSTRDGRVLAFFTGLVPCPLTTFLMVYASVNGIVLAALALVFGMAVGMLTAIALFAIAAVMFRGPLLSILERTAVARERLGRMLELGSAFAVIGLGIWMIVSR